MEMWLKLSTLVLLTVTAMPMSAPHLLILDEPSGRVEVPLGSSLTLGCSFKAGSKVRVNWCFNPNGSSEICSHKLSTEVYNKSVKQDQGGDAEITSNFTLSNVVYNNSGWYFCEVTIEIPMYKHAFSNGTQVVVIPESEMQRTTNALVTATQEPVPPTDGGLLQDWRFWFVLGVSSLILIALKVAICVTLRRRRRRSRGMECPIYANTHPVRDVSKQPSPRPGMQLDNLKTNPPPKTLRTLSPARRQEGKWSPKP